MRRGLLLVILVMVISMLTMASMGECVRTTFSGQDRLPEPEKEWFSMLPRGPVPPSGPSPCHNMFGQDHRLARPDDTICGDPP